MEQNVIEQVFGKDVFNDEVMKEKNISINQKRLKSYFPEEYSVRRCEAELWKILDEWYKRNGGK